MGASLLPLKDERKLNDINANGGRIHLCETTDKVEEETEELAFGEKKIPFGGLDHHVLGI